jgi:hypothetical protein
MSEMVLCNCQVVTGGFLARSASCPIHAPEPSLPLSAIRALIQQWRERVVVCRRICKERAAAGEMALAQAWYQEADHTEDCANDLERLCPAPAAEEEAR